MAEVIWSEPALSDLKISRNTLPLKIGLRPGNWFKIFSTKLKASMTFRSLGASLLSTLIIVKSYQPLSRFLQAEGDKVYILFVRRAERGLRRFLLSKQ